MNSDPLSVYCTGCIHPIVYYSFIILVALWKTRKCADFMRILYFSSRWAMCWLNFNIFRKWVLKPSLWFSELLLFFLGVYIESVFLNMHMLEKLAKYSWLDHEFHYTTEMRTLLLLGVHCSEREEIPVPSPGLPSSLLLQAEVLSHRYFFSS